MPEVESRSKYLKITIRAPHHFNSNRHSQTWLRLRKGHTYSVGEYGWGMIKAFPAPDHCTVLQLSDGYRLSVSPKNARLPDGESFIEEESYQPSSRDSIPALYRYLPACSGQ